MTDRDPRRDAIPPRRARLLAIAAIVVAGVCGALIGFAFTDLQCDGDCDVLIGVSTVIGAVVAAGGVAIVAVLTLRAMDEWHTITGRDAGEDPARRGRT